MWGGWGPRSWPSELAEASGLGRPRTGSAWDPPTCGGRSGPGSWWPQRARPCPQARHSPPNPLPQLQQEPLPAATRSVSGQRPLLGVGAQPCPQPPSPQRRVCRGRVEGPRGNTAILLPHRVCSVYRLCRGSGAGAQAPGFQSLPWGPQGTASMTGGFWDDRGLVLCGGGWDDGGSLGRRGAALLWGRPGPLLGAFRPHSPPITPVRK